MPPVVTLPLSVFFFQLFSLAGDWLGRAHWTDAVFAGFITGYVCYDMLHYGTQHWPMRNGLLRALKRYHLQHHYHMPDVRFGVTSPLWDLMFRTYPSRPGKKGLRVDARG